MKLLCEDTAAVMVDIQERLLPAMDKSAQTEMAAEKLVKGLRILEVPVVPLRQYPKGLGDIVPGLRKALGEYTPLDKVTFSAWDTPEIAQRIQELGKKNIIVFGIEAHICVLQTVIDLIGSGYNAVIAADCVSSRRPLDREIALRRAEQEGAVLATGESILFELLRKAGGDRFKEISTLVK